MAVSWSCGRDFCRRPDGVQDLTLGGIFMRSMITLIFCCMLLAGCSKSANTSNTPQNAATPTATVKTSVPKTPELMTVVTDADSIYTELSEKACKEMKPEPDSGALYEAECLGKGGYKVI